MNLVEIASKYILLQQGRKALKGRCPFHKDENTSLMIIAQSNYFKCMGCGAEGGPVEFMLLIDGKGRNEAVSKLAKQEFPV
jgi:DNA primase